MLLDAGCGSGLALSIAAESGAQTIGVDAAPGMLEITKRRVPSAELHVGDLESLPLAAHSCDVVVAFNSLQFTESPMRALVPAQPDAPAPLALSGDGRLEARLVDAGLHPYRWGEVEVVLSYADYDECYRAYVSAGPCNVFRWVISKPAPQHQ